MQAAQLINHDIHLISLYFVSIFNQFLKKNDLTKSQLEIIRFLMKQQEHDHPTKQRDIENYFHISNPTVTGLLNRLEQKEFILRKPDPNDRRVNLITLTKKAVSLYESIEADVERLENQMLSGLSEQSVEQGAWFLNQILKNLNQQKGDLNDPNPCFTD